MLENLYKRIEDTRLEWVAIFLVACLMGLFIGFFIELLDSPYDWILVIILPALLLFFTFGRDLNDSDEAHKHPNTKMTYEEWMSSEERQNEKKDIKKGKYVGFILALSIWSGFIVF